jgi:phenylalanyl-tRNA synthetase beta chain
MKVSVNWLKSLVKTDASVDQIAHALTMAGLEVEEVTPLVPPYDKVVVALVKSVSPHPNADKLRVTEVDAGQGGLLQIVCGAPNVAVGMRVPCALVGAKLPGIEIKPAKLRGVDSNGMLCSANELGISQDHEGLLPLAEDAPIGKSVREYLDLDDTYLTLKLTPNRGDCLSMIGIARDLAAVLGAEFHASPVEAVATTVADARPIRISAPEACGVYLGRVIKNINPQAATPDWMKRRLERAGFRSISPLVDITNYLTLERGRPMHAFDLDKLKGGIDVRFARAGETMNLLNEQAVNLKADMLLITDEAGPVAMGGVMGGLESAVTDDTKNVFFESAYFDPDVIQGKTRELGINSDAAYRFERGVDPLSARDGIEVATRLTLEICGTPTTAVGPVTSASGTLPLRKPVRVRMARVKALIGMDIPATEMAALLQRLNCSVNSSADTLEVTPPSYRFDLNIEEDFVEEIARLHGYENVPATPPQSSVPIVPLPEGRRSRIAMRHELAARGYQEVINYSFIPAEWEHDFAGNTLPVKVANPIASHMSVMRSNLIGGLIAALQSNLNRGESRLRLFEIGRCFLGAEAAYDVQPERIAALAYGPRHAEQWGEDKASKVDFFAVKGDVESFLHGLPLRFEPFVHPALHPGRAARVCVGSGVDVKAVGWVGELHPRWQQKYELPIAPILFELDVESVSGARMPHFSGLSRQPSVRRDVAITVDESTPVQAIVGTVLGQKLPFVNEFALFDLYRGSGVPAGQKSLAFRIVMQDTEKTLTDSACDASVAEIVKVISEKFGATLRK